jgi:hypothetical protein
MTGLILKHAPIGWNQDDYDVTVEACLSAASSCRPPRRMLCPPLDVDRRIASRNQQSRRLFMTNASGPNRGRPSPTEIRPAVASLIGPT